MNDNLHEADAYRITWEPGWSGLIPADEQEFHALDFTLTRLHLEDAIEAFAPQAEAQARQPGRRNLVCQPHCDE